MVGKLVMIEESRERCGLMGWQYLNILATIGLFLAFLEEHSSRALVVTPLSLKAMCWPLLLTHSYWGDPAVKLQC